MNSLPEKKRWPLALAQRVAEELIEILDPHCFRVEIAGSIRRRKEAVGDVEILFIPEFCDDPSVDLFAPAARSLADLQLELMLASGAIAKRLNVNGGTAWGADIKLAVHCASGIPVDFFTATEANWWNYLVCRTGGAVSNMRIASEAKARGWKWTMNGPGFVRRGGPDHGRIVPIHSEREVFEFVHLPYLPPEQRK